MNILTDFENRVSEVSNILYTKRNHVISCLLMILCNKKNNFFGNHIDIGWDCDGQNPNVIVSEKFNDLSLVYTHNLLTSREIEPAQGSTGTAFVVLKNDKDEYLKISYDVDSYGDPLYNFNINAELSIVSPVTKTITVYE